MLNFIGLGNGLINVVLLLVILVVLVVIHEFGHFVGGAPGAASESTNSASAFRRARRVLGSDGETTYTLNWLPIGGFVRMEGEEGESDDPRAFVRQRLPARVTILLAGVTMNLLLALRHLHPHRVGSPIPVANVRVASVQPDTPAASIGLPGRPTRPARTPHGNPTYDNTGDVIVAIDGQQFPWFDRLNAQITPELAVPALPCRPDASRSPIQHQPTAARETSGDAAQWRHRRAGRARWASASRRTSCRATSQHDPVDARSSWASSARSTPRLLIFRGLGDLVTNISQPAGLRPGRHRRRGRPDSRTSCRPIFLLWFIGLLSANLAVVNALPLPPLDGGRVAVALIQAAHRQPLQRSRRAARLPDRLRPAHGAAGVDHVLRHRPPQR